MSIPLHSCHLPSIHRASVPVTIPSTLPIFVRCKATWRCSARTLYQDVSSGHTHSFPLPTSGTVLWQEEWILLYLSFKCSACPQVLWDYSSSVQSPVTVKVPVYPSVFPCSLSIQTQNLTFPHLNKQTFLTEYVRDGPFSSTAWTH